MNVPVARSRLNKVKEANNNRLEEDVGERE